MIAAVKSGGKIHVGWSSNTAKKRKEPIARSVKDTFGMSAKFFKFQDSYILLDMEPGMWVPVIEHEFSSFLEWLEKENRPLEDVILREAFVENTGRLLAKLKMLKVNDDQKDDVITMFPWMSIVTPEHIYYVSNYRKVDEVEEYICRTENVYITMSLLKKQTQDPKEQVLRVTQGGFSNDITYINDSYWLYYIAGEDHLTYHLPYREEEETVSLEDLLCR